ncbi:MAG: serine hydrolase domain-containing protein [Candidatus Acidiferrum sp.]|jgi:D-alanyl-D-alanine-carboxypeptidase/D-alanyl-D-alanine-endopeptidase
MSSALPESPSNDAIQALLNDRLRRKHAVGLIVGLLGPKGCRIVAAGTTGNPARSEIDERTLFEIASITKIFTAAALADAIERGTLSLADPLSRFLSLRAGGIGDRTLKELVTHTSGLPRLPSGFNWWWNLLGHPRDPYANYSHRDLDAYIKTLKGSSLPRGKFLYSNLGVGLLGNVLAAHGNTDYAGLIAQRVTIPLQMSRTFLQIPQTEQYFVAQPHTKSLRPTPIWTMASLPGAGGLLSSMQDMLRFASAALSTNPPLFPSMIRPFAKADGTNRCVGLGWMLRGTPEYQVAWHNGGTGGSRSFLGLEFKTGRAVVALANSVHSLDQLGASLLLGPKLSAGFF